MNKLFFMLLLATIVGMIGCSPISVRTDYDREVSFEKYKTFKWMPTPKNPKRGTVPVNSLLDKRVRSAVENELTAKGYQVITTGPADALVAYHVGVQTRIDVDYYGYRYWHRYAHVRKYKEGTIVIDIVDPELKQLVWRGAAQGVVGHPEGNAEKVKEAVAKVFEKYPPQ